MLAFAIIHRVAGQRPRFEDEQVPGPYDLLQFLGSLTRFPHLARLSECDPYDDTLVEGDWLVGLITDIDDLLSGQADGSIRVLVPDLIGDPISSTQPPDPYDLNQFLAWLRQLRHLAMRARDMGFPLTAAGD